jgi:heat shock protein HslJ
MAEQDEQLASRGTAYLGDRIIVNSLSIENGQIVVDMIVQGPEDPFSSPTQQVLQTYELQGAELQKTSSTVIGAVEAQSENQSEIMGIVWEWQELTTPVEQVIIDNSDKYTIEFLSDGQITVLADCNSGTGTYDLNSNRLTIDITSTTLALCAPESQSDLFFRNLNAAASYFMEADNLFIEQYADGGTMRFAKN